MWKKYTVNSSVHHLEEKVIAKRHSALISTKNHKHFQNQNGMPLSTLLRNLEPESCRRNVCVYMCVCICLCVLCMYVHIFVCEATCTHMWMQNPENAG